MAAYESAYGEQVSTSRCKREGCGLESRASLGRRTLPRWREVLTCIRQLVSQLESLELARGRARQRFGEANLRGALEGREQSGGLSLQPLRHVAARLF